MGLATNLTDPSSLIQNIVMIVLAVGILTVGLPILITNIVNLSTISNLGFATFFSGGGVVLLALGAAIVLAILALLGLNRSER